MTSTFTMILDIAFRCIFHFSNASYLFLSKSNDMQMQNGKPGTEKINRRKKNVESHSFLQ